MIECLEYLQVNKIQVLSIMGSLVLLWFILGLIQAKKLKEEYSLLWLGFGIIFLIVSIFRPILDTFAHLVGIVYAPAALLLILVLSLFVILIQFSVVISKLTEKNKVLIQELGLLKAEIKDFQKRKGEK